ncbi:MAG: toll/interleukin-1 receptor domain-containing protein [Nitrospirae bacterium]|nr:toll/interleukin-1 receptor domain-containing protein [Nitrospirota bacterium]
MNKTKKDFFISYNKHDEKWAEWIAWQLENAGYDIVIQLWDWGPGNNFILEMQKATELCQHTIIVLSPHFLDSEYTQPEWAQAFAQDPTGENRLLIPVRVANCELNGFFKPLVYIDFLEAPPSDKQERREYLIDKLLNGVDLKRRKPMIEPPLPDAVSVTVTSHDAIANKGRMDDKTRAVRGHQQTDITKENQPAGNFYGKQRREIINHMVTGWLPSGPAVAILQGFPGCGKTQLALSVAVKSRRSLDPIEPQSESTNPSLDLLTDLAVALDSEGISDLMHELDMGANGDLFNALLKVLRREQILIILDEFQRLFADTDTLPPMSWQVLVEKLNNSNRPAGRLMLISNRSIKSARWCESCITKELKGLTDPEAESFLLELLKSKGLTSKIPAERLKEIGHRLGGNPRALKTLVASLMSESLEDLISLAPDLFRPGDVALDPALVEEFERELIERTLPYMEVDLLKFMRSLAIHRRPFKKEALSEFTYGMETTQALRKQLIDRFLLENTTIGDSLHPLAREISVSRLRAEKDEWKQAHSFAANYHFRHFKALQMKGTQKLTTSYAELRHHLFESGRIAELNLASEKLTKFALSQITKPTQSQVPDNVETLEERIALISALPDDQRPKGLEYHLALCLKQRNIGDDYQKALFHVRKATGRHAYYAVWLLRLDLEYALNGIDAMLKTQAEALRHLGAGSNSFSIYLRSARILEKDNKLNDAINVLEKGIDTTGVTCLAPLISQCAEYMQQAEKYHDAIRILKKGLDTPDMPELGTLYIRCANLMAKTNRLDDAILLLKKGVNIAGMTKLYSFYLLMAEFMEKDGKSEEAILLLKEGIANPKVRDPIKLYCLCAELLVKNRRIEEANTLIESGIASKVIKDPVPLYHFFAELMEKSGNAEDGVKLLKSAMANRQMMSERSLYLACATLLFHSRNLDDAIEVLQRGILVTDMKERGQLYQMCADLMGRQGHLGDAIGLLEKGIADKNVNNQGSLYHSCSELMVKADRLEDAIDLLKRGINAPAIANKSELFQACAKLLAKAQRPDEGIKLLERAIGLPGLSGMVNLYQTCAKLMSNARRKQDAIRLLKKAIDGPKLGNLASLYQLCAELMKDTGQRTEAILLLKKGIANYPKDKSLKAFYEKAINP